MAIVMYAVSVIIYKITTMKICLTFDINLYNRLRSIVNMSIDSPSQFTRYSQIK